MYQPSNPCSESPSPVSGFVSVIIVSWNTSELTTECLQSIYTGFRGSNLQYEIILVDNASTDNTVINVKNDYPHVLVVQNKENVGFSRAVNQGIRIANGNYILLLNTDIIFPVGTIDLLHALFDRDPAIGIIGPALYSEETRTCIEFSYFTRYPNGWDFIWDVVLGYRVRSVKDHFKILTRSTGITGDTSKRPASMEVAAVTGAFLYVRKEVFDTVGNFDENFFFYFEDIDFCKRAADYGWIICYYSEVSAIHLHNQSVNKRDDQDVLFFNSFYYYLNKHNRKLPVYLIKLLRKFVPKESGG